LRPRDDEQILNEMEKSARAFSARRVHDRKKTVYIKQRVKQMKTSIVAEHV